MDTGTAVQTYGWDTAFAIPVPDVNKAIVDHKSSPANFSHSESAFQVNGDFGDWQITQGGDGKNIRLALPLRNVVLKYNSTGKILTFDSGQAIIEVMLHYIPHTGAVADDASGTFHDLVAKTQSDSPDEPVVSMIELNLTPTPGTVSQALISEAITSWGTANLAEFNHVFTVVNLNRMVDTGQWSFVNPNYTSYAYLDLDTLDKSIFGVLCMTGDRTGDALSEQISVSAIPGTSKAGFLVSQARTLYDLVRPAIQQAYPGLTDSNFLINPDGNKLYLTDGTSVDLPAVTQNGNTYYPKLNGLTVESNGEVITLTSNTSTEIVTGITATCVAVHWYTITLGTSNNGQTLKFAQYQTPSITHNIVQSPGSQLTQLLIEIILAVVLIILGILTDGAAFIVGGIVIGLIMGADQIVPALIEKANKDDSPSIDLLLLNAVNPIKWPNSNTFKLDYASMNASLQLGGDPLFV